MKTRPIYNLEFPSWCQELNICGYKIVRVSDYQEKIQQLQHLIISQAEYQKSITTGEHIVTAQVQLPTKEKKAIFDWAGSKNTALMDILLILSLFTRRDVFAGDPNGDTTGAIIRDPRMFTWGGILRTSLPYKEKINAKGDIFDIGFEEGINQIYTLIQSQEWQQEYNRGYFLILALHAFKRQPLESSFIQCWTIWEHLFAIHNQNWLPDKQIRQLSSSEKIAFILVKYALRGKIDSLSRKRIETLSEIRNRLIHYGKFPLRSNVHDDAELFIQLTEFVIAKSLGLSPSNIFNTVENLEEFLIKKSTTIGKG